MLLLKCECSHVINISRRHHAEVTCHTLRIYVWIRVHPLNIGSQWRSEERYMNIILPLKEKIIIIKSNFGLTFCNSASYLTFWTHGYGTFMLSPLRKNFLLISSLVERFNLFFLVGWHKWGCFSLYKLTTVYDCVSNGVNCSQSRIVA